MRVETRGWLPVYGPAEVVKADEDNPKEYYIRFTEQLLVSRELDSDFEHAYPTSVTSGPVTPPTRTRGKRAAAVTTTPIIQGVTLGGSPTMPAMGMLPRVRFNPAREQAKPTCELLRMQVNFTTR